MVAMVSCLGHRTPSRNTHQQHRSRMGMLEICRHVFDRDRGEYLASYFGDVGRAFVRGRKERVVGFAIVIGGVRWGVW
jgi:hypothetical protein